MLETDPEFIALQYQTGASEALAVEAADATFAVGGGASTGSSSGMQTSGSGVVGGSVGGTIGGIGYGSGEQPPCFTGDTEIIMGGRFPTLKEIKHINCGVDKVIAFDCEGNLHEAFVTGYFVHSVTELLAIDFGRNNPLMVTREHPIWRGGHTFSPAVELSIGDEVCAFEIGGWKMVKVSSIHTRRFPDRIRVYNLGVEIYHTYIAGGIGVHNLKSQQEQLQQ